jgi:hypothetical protein
MSPINIANNIISRNADELNKKLAGIIQPQRFKESVGFLIRQVQTVDRAIAQIQKGIGGCGSNWQYPAQQTAVYLCPATGKKTEIYQARETLSSPTFGSIQRMDTSTFVSGN